MKPEDNAKFLPETQIHPRLLDQGLLYFISKSTNNRKITLLYIDLITSITTIYFYGDSIIKFLLYITADFFTHLRRNPS